MASKGKRKIRYVYRDKLTGRFVSRTAKRAKRYKVSLSKSGAPKRGALKAAGTRRLFTRQIKLKTQPRKITERVYEIPFSLERVTERGKSVQRFVPSKSAISAVFSHENDLQDANHIHTAVCKVNVVFRESATEPEDADSWIQIPIGRRIPVDEPNGDEIMYDELVKFLLGYDVWAINVLQLSVLVLPV